MLSSTPGSSLARDPATCGPNIRWREAENWGGNTRILPRPCLGTDCGSSVRLSRAIDEMCACRSSALRTFQESLHKWGQRAGEF